MTATTAAGLIGSILAGLYPTIPISRDSVADRAQGTFPRITLHEGISRVALGTSAPKNPRMQELIQIDIWQKRDGTPEDVTMRPTIELALDAHAPTLIGAGGCVYRLRADGAGVAHDYDPATHVVHDVITVRATVAPSPLAVH